MVFWICAYALCMIGDRATGKLTSVGMEGENKVSYSFYYVTHSLVACMFFLSLSKFNIQINRATLIYSVFFGLTILLSLLVSIVSLRYINVLGSGILSTPFILVLTAAVGAVLWSEKITVAKCIAILLTSLSAVFFFLDTYLLSRKNKSGDSPRTHVNLKAYIPLMTATIILTVAQNSLIVAFAKSTSVTDENSFYFLTNFVMLVWALGMLAFVSIRRKGEFKIGARSFFKPKRALPVAIKVILGNVMALAMIPILAEMDISTFTPLSSAFSIMVGVMVSLMFKEKLGIFSYISAAVAIVAMFVQ